MTPTRATEASVGLDFYSPANYIIPPCSQLLIPTQIKLGIPLGHYGRLASKSGLAILHHLHVISTVFESKDKPTQMTKQSFTIVDFITYRKSIHFELICKDVHN